MVQMYMSNISEQPGPKAIKYFIRARKQGWFSRKKYYAENEWITLGPFNSIEAAIEQLTKGKVSIRDIVVET